MRITIDLPTDQIAALDQLSARQDTSRAELIRKAVSAYLADQNRIALDQRVGFGAWKHKQVDGVEYQRRVRAEWDDTK